MFISVTSKVMNVNRLKAATVYEVKVQSFCQSSRVCVECFAHAQ